MRIAIVGGGPSALFVFKALIEASPNSCEIDIFERGRRLATGMPYSEAGANVEHVTNVSGNEIPKLITPLVDWIKAQPPEYAISYNLDPKQLHEYKVVPRLLLGDYLSSQFGQLISQAQLLGIPATCHFQNAVKDIEESKDGMLRITLENESQREFDVVIVCTGHVWKKQYEDTHPGYFDSPYPPQKLIGHYNHPVAIRGTSLTAIDAVRTLALQHGDFVTIDQQLTYQPRKDCSAFRIVLHSREGFLPGIRFHLEDPQLSKKSLLSEAALRQHRKANEGYVSLDYLFEQDFKLVFREQEPRFYELIKDMNMEEFVESMLRERERSEPFVFFKREYAEAKQSIRNEESIFWKEKLAVLSYAMNHPAKYFSAEDRLRLQRVLMPLISLVIAFVPQSSCEQLIALHDAGILDLESVGHDSRIELRPVRGIVYHHGESNVNSSANEFETFIDCVGQTPLDFEEFPFKTLLKQGKVRPATLKFRDSSVALRLLEEGSRNIEVASPGEFTLRVPGVAIDDHYRIIDVEGKVHARCFIMAVPLIAGYNPDYSGLDFCEAAAKKIVEQINEIPAAMTDALAIHFVDGHWICS